MPQMVPHGTLDYTELAEWGYDPGDLIVFSSNINPYGPPASVVDLVAARIDASTLALYPDRLSQALRRALAAHHDVPPDAILVGNGTADLMWLLAVLYLRGRSVAVLSPTFGEYANAANLVEASVTPVSLPGWRQGSRGTYLLDQSTLCETASRISELSPEVVFLCNPNSPTGEHMHPDEVETLLSAAPDALWIIDEAYVAFTPEPWSAVKWSLERNIIVLRSMTKDFALGGLRLGYVVAHSDMIDELAAAQPPWNVNAIAQIAGEACMDELEWRADTLDVLRADTKALQRRLTELGYRPLPTTTNYFLVPIENPAALRSSLLRRRIVVRDCTSFGMPSFIRLATQQPIQNQALLDALATL